EGRIVHSNELRRRRNGADRDCDSALVSVSIPPVPRFIREGDVSRRFADDQLATLETDRSVVLRPTLREPGRSRAEVQMDEIVCKLVKEDVLILSVECTICEQEPLPLEIAGPVSRKLTVDHRGHEGAKIALTAEDHHGGRLHFRAWVNPANGGDRVE